jgi:hypothetical protein
MSYESTAKNAIVMWQTNEESGVGEPALLIESYMGCFQITQEDQRININYESIKELCKILKQLKEPE